MVRTVDIVVAGHVCLDITPSFPEDLGRDPAAVFRPGRLIIVGRPTLSGGGAVSNTGLACLRMGLKTRLMGKVGDDAFGSIIRSLFAREGATDGMVEARGELSSYSCVIAPKGIDRIFFHCPGCNDSFTAGDVRRDAVGDARLFHFGYPPLMARFYSDGGAELARLFSSVRAAGTVTSLDTAYPDPASPGGKADWRRILAAALPHVDIFTPSLEEIFFMLEPELFARRAAAGGDLSETAPAADVRHLADRILALGARIVLLKCGARGLYLRTAPAERLAPLASLPLDVAAWADRELWMAPYEVEVVSATGSGDCAIAGFLAALLRGADPAGSLTAGVGAGALNVQTPDAVSGIRPYDEILAYAKGLSRRLPLTLPESEGWRYDAASSLWRGPGERGR